MQCLYVAAGPMTECLLRGGGGGVRPREVSVRGGSQCNSIDRNVTFLVQIAKNKNNARRRKFPA